MVTKMGVALIVSLVAVIITGAGLFRADILGLLGAIFIVVGFVETFLLMGTGSEQEWFGMKLIILGIILFIILSLVFPVFPWLQ